MLFFLKRQLGKALVQLIICFLRFSIVSILIIIRPFRMVKLAFIDGTRIQPFIVTPEYLLRLQAVDPSPRKTHYLLLTDGICNNAVFEMIKRYFFCINLASYSVYFLLAFPRGKSWIQPFVKYSYGHEIAPIFQKEKNIMSFTAEEHAKGQAYLSLLGIGPDDWYACFANRDSAYLDEAMPNIDWSYHDYRDSSIGNYIEAMEYVAEKGGYALRMGAKVSESLSDKHGSHIIDYASTNRDEFLDIYLFAHAKFAVVGNTGISGFSAVFDVPYAFINLLPLNHSEPYTRSDIYMPKVLWWKNKKRPLNFLEMRDLGFFSGTSGIGRTEFYQNHCIVPEENTSEEILAVTQEINEVIDGIPRPKAQMKLQKQFKDKFRSNFNEYEKATDISGTFLSRHQELMTTDNETV